ncbi:MAG: YvcK family protein [Clostridia bacterium]|nr:YvcK family protein [Clostridia bacterium]
MKGLRWLTPGLGIKRWLFLAAVGSVLAFEGLGLLLPFEETLNVQRYGFFKQLDGNIDVLVGILMVGAGLGIFLWGFSRSTRSILAALAPNEKEDDIEDYLLERVYNRRYLEKGPKIIAIGGGTGLSVLLRGLKEHTSNITAVVTVTDDGGSSGRLRGDFDILPPGDIRNCLVALADTESSMRRLFDYRFDKGKGLKGHSLGNLLITAMSEMEGDFYSAVQEIAKVLAVRGRVVPSTLSKVTLGAVMEKGGIIKGQTNIVSQREKIDHVFLIPKECSALEETVDAILNADAVILGPGSLYTSVIPNLLVKGIPEALIKTKAVVFYVCNIMTQPGETDGYDAADHLEAILEHVGANIVDYVVLNNQGVPNDLLKKYLEDSSVPVAPARDKLEKMGVEIIEEALVDNCHYVRHDPHKLARIIMEYVPHSNGVNINIPSSADTNNG